MWNFAGRQNDIQSSGEIEHGNWITGIPFIDNLLYGDQNMLPQELKDNKGSTMAIPVMKNRKNTTQNCWMPF